MKKPKMVNAWAFSVTDNYGTNVCVFGSRDCASLMRGTYIDKFTYPCGPIVRIEVPAPKEASK